ncbi:MAG: beta-glucosidase, partial [Microbacteriaceae bacterium]|nr:beta-glucosidase [Microbacteriaceae bacterium]
EVAARAMVLLKNDAVDGAPLLPLDPSRIGSLAVAGRLADRANTGDNGSSDVRSPEVVTPLDGLRAALPGTRIDFIGEDAEDAARAAAGADAALVVVGYTAADEGEYIEAGAFLAPDLVATYPPTEGDEWAESFLSPTADGERDGSIVGGSAGGDRASLRLHDDEVALIRAVAAANPRTIVAIVAAGAVITEEWRHEVPAVLLSWYAGSEGGAALADVLTGAVDVSGRLPFSVPTSEEHLPFFDRDATAITYDRWFGQRLLDRLGVSAAFPLGYGLSYTTFEIAELELGEVAGESFGARVTVRNTGNRDGRHVVQLYGEPQGAGDDFPARVLLGFASVAVAAGATETVEVRGSVRPLLRWSGGGFTPAADEAIVRAAANAADLDGPSGRLRLG